MKESENAVYRERRLDPERVGGGGAGDDEITQLLRAGLLRVLAGSDPGDSGFGWTGVTNGIHRDR